MKTVSIFKNAICLLLLLCSMAGFAQVMYKYDRVDDFSEELGEVVVPPQYDYVNSFSEGLAVVKKNQNTDL